MLSPVLAYITQADRVDLREQMGLQLGTKGSHTKITQGARANMNLGSMAEKQYYFDVVNIDRYDVVLGTPFVTRHNVELDFKNHCIIINGKAIPVYDAVHEVEVIRTCEQEQRKGLAKQLHSALIVDQADHLHA